MARRKPDLKLAAHRPAIPIDWNMVDRYLESDCTGTEIAGVIGCHPHTLYERCVQEKGITFSEYSAQKRSKGDALLRAKQFAEAMRGDRGMLIWLGKQRLGQKENHDVNVNGTMNVGVVNFGSNSDPKPWKSTNEKNDG